MTKITTDAVLAKIPDKESLDSIDDDGMTGRRPLPVTLTLNEWRFVRARLASTSPAPDGWEVAGRAVLSISTDPDKDAYGNGWNDCLDIVFMAYLDAAVPVKAAAPQPEKT